MNYSEEVNILTKLVVVDSFFQNNLDTHAKNVKVIFVIRNSNTLLVYKPHSCIHFYSLIPIKCVFVKQTWCHVCAHFSAL